MHMKQIYLHLWHANGEIFKKKRSDTPFLCVCITYDQIYFLLLECNLGKHGMHKHSQEYIEYSNVTICMWIKSVCYNSCICDVSKYTFASHEKSYKFITSVFTCLSCLKAIRDQKNSVPFPRLCKWDYEMSHEQKKQQQTTTTTTTKTFVEMKEAWADSGVVYWLFLNGHAFFNVCSEMQIVFLVTLHIVVSVKQQKICSELKKNSSVRWVVGVQSTELLLWHGNSRNVLILQHY